MSTDARQSRTGPIAFAIIAFGAVLRLAQYLHHRSLWLDEAMLALNVVSRDYTHLMTTLDDHQAAPIGFLWISRFVVTTLGRSEMALRLYPLLAGIAALPLTWAVSRRLGGRATSGGAALIAVAIVALSPTLIYQSNEFKQYSSDVFVSLAVVLAGLTIARTPLTFRNLAAFTLLGVVALVLSHPAVFTLAGVGIAIVAARARETPKELARLAPVFAVWALEFAFLYPRFLRPILQDQYLYDYWSIGMAPRGAGLLADLRWPFEVFFASLRFSAGFWIPGLAGAFVLVGCIAFAYRDWRKGLFLLLPAVAALGAASLRIYPFADRLVLFLVPLYAVTISVGLFFMCEGLGRARVPVIATLLAVLLFGGARTEARETLRPAGREEVRLAMEVVAHEARKGDVVYVYNHTTPAFEYYRSILPADLTVVVGAVRTKAAGQDSLAAEVAHLHGNARTWSLFSHSAAGEDDLVTAFRADGKEIEARHFEGASVYLFDFSR